MIEQSPDTRNHPARGVVSSLLTPVSVKLEKLGITPNEVTIFGGISGVSLRIFSAIVHLNPELHQFVPGWALAVGMGSSDCLDMLDGNLARYFDKIGKKRNKSLGPKVDVTTDRISASASYLCKAFVARQRQDLYGEAVAVGCSIFHNLPSVGRALAEQRGKVVKEGAIGSYPTRAGLDIISSSFQNDALFAGLLIQPTLDSATLAISISTAAERFRIAMDPKVPAVLPVEVRSQAADRLSLLLGITAVSVLTAGSYWLASHPPVS
jgi:phosphatidylglycerophosphate synthase